MDPGPPVQLEQQIGELAGDLQVADRLIASGGYADIYRGVWTSPDGVQVEVAVKELKIPIPKNQQSDPEALQTRTDIRMKREVLAWSQTTHPNLHPLLGYRSKPRPRLISPWCRHGNLTDYLQRNPGLSKLEKLRFIHQTGRALLHLHSQAPPICHADIKPENVLINDFQEASLSDFGLSRVLQDFDESSGLTTTGDVKGTLNYMAGELFLGEKARPGRETDVYAFGGLILTVMSGSPPYFKLPKLNIMLQATQYQPPKPENHPDLPPSDPLWILMRRCWNKTPSARLTMREVLGELNRYTNIIQSSSESIPYAPSVFQNDVGEGFSTNFHSPNPPPQGQFLALLGPNPAPVEDSSVTETEDIGIPVAEGIPYAQKIFENLEVESKAIPVVGRYVGAVADVGLTLVGMIETMDMDEDVAKALGLNARKLAVLLEHVKQELGLRRLEEIATRITRIKRELQFARGKVMEWDSSGLLQSASSSCDHSEGLMACERTVRKVLEEIELLVSLNTDSLMAEFEDTELQKDRRQLLDRLGDGNYGGQGNTIEDITCLPGTRVEILDRIDSWIRDTLTSERVLWICGMAGRGKSTIASTVAHSWKYRASCAIFHFRRGRNDLDARLVCALARQLGSSLIPEVKNKLLESVRGNEDVANQRLDEQFKILLVASLGKLKDQPHPILIVVDALDECQSYKDVIDFIKLIDRHTSSLPPNVRFILTCRPESSLLRALEPKRWPVEDLDLAPDVSSDLALFIIRACTQIRNDHGLSENWPSPGDVARLVEMSQGLFQWAQTAITHVGDGSPVVRLRGLLQNPTSCGLDNLYHQVLSKAFKDAEYDPMRHQLLYWILGTLALAPYPISLDVIAFLYADSGAFNGIDVEEILHFLRTDVLGRLKSILFIPVSPTEPIRLMHTSIRDLLLDRKRCKKKPYFVKSAQDNRRLASLCLRLMDRDLRHNICNLSDLSKANSDVQDMIERHLPRGLQYCCRSWSIHIMAGIKWSGTTVEAIDDIWTKFKLVSETKFLYWLEVMSLIGAITEAFNVAQEIHRWLQERPNDLSDDILPSLWNDAQRFIAAFHEPISFGALHIYWSALPHCPVGTKLWEKYSGQAGTRILLGPKRQSSWPQNIWTTYTGEHVNIVRFSPDGKALASGSNDGTVSLWDAGTGAPLGGRLTGHSHRVTSVSFSPDGKALASGSRDGTVCLWDAGTGAPLGDPLTGHSDWVTSVSFSPDGKVLASGSVDETVRLLDAGTGAPLRDPLIGHNDWVTSVSFSPDGKILASGSQDWTVRLWDAGTGAPLRDPLIGHNDWVTSVSFSPDGKILASGSQDWTVRLWDAGTGAPLRDPLIGHNDRVTSVSFSPDGKILASGSQDWTVRLWDAGTGAPLGKPLDDHRYGVTSVSFSADGKVLVAGSWDGMVRLWDAGTGAPLCDPLIGHIDCVTSVSFSPDGKILASGSNDGTVRLWDAGTVEPLGDLLTGDSDPVASASFSSDGKILASGFQGGTIRLWDAGTGAPLGDPLTGHSDSVMSVSFSADGKVLASGYQDGTIRLWNAGTGAPLGDPLTGHGNSVTAVSFSPDGKVLASGSRETVRLWDVGTGAPLCDPLIGHYDSAWSLSFSPDGKVLASAFSDGVVRLWDASTGAPLCDPLTGHSDTVMSVSFSPDGKVLASWSDDQTVRLWDASTGAPLVNPLTGEYDWVECYLSAKWPPLFPQYCTTSSLDPLNPRPLFEFAEFLDPWVYMDEPGWLMSYSKCLWWTHFPLVHGDTLQVIHTSGRLALFACDRSMLLIFDLPRNATLRSMM